METLALDSRLSPLTAAFLSRNHKLFIDDEWVASPHRARPFPCTTRRRARLRGVNYFRR
jgi:hypothetical protein